MYELKQEPGKQVLRTEGHLAQVTNREGGQMLFHPIFSGRVCLYVSLYLTFIWSFTEC